MNQVTFGDLKNIKYATQEGMLSPIRYDDWYGQLKDSEPLPFYHKKEVDELLKKEDKGKVVIPQYVADWYEVSKDDFERELFLAITQVDGGVLEYDLEFAHWLDTVSNNPIETLVSMKNYGYEVEIIEKNHQQIVLEWLKKEYTGDAYPFGTLACLFSQTPKSEVIIASLEMTIKEQAQVLQAFLAWVLSEESL